MKRGRPTPDPELHPGYEAAIEAQKMRVECARSILDCVKYVLVNDRGEDVDIADAVVVAWEILNEVVNGLDSVELLAVARKWRPTAIDRMIMRARDQSK